MLKKVKEFQPIYYYRSIFDTVEKGIVIDPTIRKDVYGSATPNPTVINLISKVNFVAKVDINGEEENDYFGGTGAAYLDNCFLTAKEAWDARITEIKKYEETLRSEITDLDSLLMFPLKHCIGGEDANWYARRVYAEGIKKYVRDPMQVSEV